MYAPTKIADLIMSYELIAALALLKVWSLSRVHKTYSDEWKDVRTILCRKSIMGEVILLKTQKYLDDDRIPPQSLICIIRCTVATTAISLHSLKEFPWWWCKANYSILHGRNCTQCKGEADIVYALWWWCMMSYSTLHRLNCAWREG